MKYLGNHHGLKVALVTDWLTNLGGAENVVAVIADLYDQAPIFTTFYQEEKTREKFPDAERIVSSFFNKIPKVNNRQITIAPFLKSAIGDISEKLKDYDLIISFSSSVAKNIKLQPHQKHVCYIHTPIRYVWQYQADPRFDKFPKIMMPFIKMYLNRLKKWDLKQSDQVNLFIANSSETASRVNEFYNREAKVLFPPVNFREFLPVKNEEKENYFFGFGRAVTYKRFDLLVDTFLQIPDKKLKLLIHGPEVAALEEKIKKSGATNIEIIGRLPFSELKIMLAKATAMLLPQKEDAGIVQLEAFASGTPVIAYKAGGVLDVLQKNINGLFFDEQTPESLKKAVFKFDANNFETEIVRNTAEKFSEENFAQNFKNIVKDFLN